MKRIFFIFIIIFVCFPAFAKAEIGIYQQLGKSISLDLVFNDEKGNPVTLRQLTNNRPSILTFVYYKCPGICTPVLQSIGKLLDQLESPSLLESTSRLTVGKDYSVIALSIDPTENHTLAASKKKNYYAAMEKNISDTGWRFLTGSAENIKKITEATGFTYEKRDDGTFTHTATLITLTREGKITRYIYGTTYLPLDVRLALLEASQGRVGPTITKVLQYCFSYDPAGRKYTLNILRVAGTTSTLAAVGFFVFLIFYSRRRNKERG